MPGPSKGRKPIGAGRGRAASGRGRAGARGRKPRLLDPTAQAAAAAACLAIRQAHPDVKKVQLHPSVLADLKALGAKGQAELIQAFQEGEMVMERVDLNDLEPEERDLILKRLEHNGAERADEQESGERTRKP